MPRISIGFAFTVITVCLATSCSTMPDVNNLPTHKEMPDPLVMNDGTTVTNTRQWEVRRKEIKHVLEYYSIGTMPPPPGNVQGHDIKSQLVVEGKVNYRLVHLTFGPEEKSGFDIAVFTPADSNGPFPTFVHIAFDPTPGTVVIPSTNNPVSSTNSLVARKKSPVISTDPDAAARRFAPELDRGYAVVTYYYRETGDDNPSGLTNKFIAAYPNYSWHLEGAWAWGMSRVVDYLQTQSFADKSKLIAIGHSRLGKAALIAGAFDDRFAMVAPAGSGAFGTGAFRFNGATNGGKEGLNELVKRFPYWVSPELLQFSGQIDKLPFDQHWLIALVAPRPLISLEGIDDQFCNGNAFKESYLAAKPVYELLVAQNKLGFNFRPGTHMLSPLDWQAAMDFADQQLRGMDVKRVFNQFPPQEQLH
jgi:hypothetical protein